MGVHAVYDSATPKPADKVLVNGPGPIGLLVAQVAKCCGCVVIISGVDSDSQRLALGEGLGIDRAVNSQMEDLAAVVSEMTGGKGLYLAFDCSGVQAAISGTLHMLRRKAAMVQVGLTKDEMTIPYALLPQRELSIRGTFGHNWLSWEKGIELILTGQVKVKPLVSGAYSIDRWEEAFTAAAEQRGVKVLIHPNA